VELLVGLVTAHRAVARVQRKRAAAAAAAAAGLTGRRPPRQSALVRSVAGGGTADAAATTTATAASPAAVTATAVGHKDVDADDRYEAVGDGAGVDGWLAEAVVSPLPMPVALAPAAELAPILDYLGAGRGAPPPAQPVVDPRGSQYHLAGGMSFVRGTLFGDGRLDMCKQAVGPAHVGELADAVRRCPAVRHVLLGNNLACGGAVGTDGARSLAALMRPPPAGGLAGNVADGTGGQDGGSVATTAAAAPPPLNPPAIETWYLAGNCIDAAAFGVVVDALVGPPANTVARALWLKRNPLAPGCGAALGRLLHAPTAVKLLDLSGTGLLDAELKVAAAALTGCPGSAPTTLPPCMALRHLYLDATGLTVAGVRCLAAIVATGRLSLASLSLSQNPLADAGIGALAGAAPHLPTLKRLNVGATGMTGAGMEVLTAALSAHCPRLRFLNAGWYKSSTFLRAPPNALGAAGAAALAALLTTHPALQAVDVSRAPAVRVGLAVPDVTALVAALGPHQSLVGIVDRHDPVARRRLAQPRRVVHIDSIYRT